MNLQEITDRLEIRDQIDRYSSGLTRRAWDEMCAVFHDDAEWRATEPFNLYFKTRKGIQDGLSGIVGQSDYLVQMVHSVVIDLAGDRATACVVLNEMSKTASTGRGLFLLGTYNDELVRHNGKWLFIKRTFLPVYVDLSPLAGDAVGTGDLKTYLAQKKA